MEGVLSGAEQVSVCNAFAGRTVLLTGITGFVGSLVLEQLLRTCPEVHKVYVIARKKHSVSGPERVQRMLHSHPLFHLVRAQICKGASSQDSEVRSLQEAFSDRHSEQSNAFPNVEVLAGDMTLPGYGLGACEMQRLKEETEVVIHAAASISFDDHINDAITHNYTVSCTRCLLLLTALPHFASSCCVFSWCRRVRWPAGRLSLPFATTHCLGALIMLQMAFTFADFRDMLKQSPEVLLYCTDPVACKINPDPYSGLPCMGQPPQCC